MTEPGSIRNLEALEEDDDDTRRMPAGVTVALVGLGAACIVFATLALGGRAAQPVAVKPDPLGDLVSRRSTASAAASARANATDLQPRDVTFPQMLSDDDKPPTALAAVRGNPAAAALAPMPTQPPPATDRLSVVPLPAQAVLEATPIVTRPRDAMTRTASDVGQINTTPAPTGDATPAGHEGGYQLQVSSFRTQAEAQAFADQLRARAHKAYVVEAHVPGRGTWFRVRIGPFPTQHVATQYRASFEAREHVVPFIVSPETVAKAH